MGYDTLTIGLDAGGTSTRAVLTTETGECVGYGVGGRGNPTSSGVEIAGDGVMASIAAALAASSATMADVSVIATAMAGQRIGDEEGAWLMARLSAEGFAGRLVFESDLAATYFTGSAEPFGYAIVAGTGACAVRIEDGRIAATADGLGWLLGDRGSGYWIGHRVARAVVRELDHAGPRTALTPALLAHLGITAETARREGRLQVLDQVVEALYALRPIELAALAPLAFTAADAVAERILHRAGAHLADTLAAVLDGPGPVVLGGSVLCRDSPVRDAFVRRLGAAADGLDMRPVVDGAVGAGLLALRAAGVAVSPETLARLSGSLAGMR
ncbi:N-acetylglucosamine kinase [Microbacterium paludicola]|uniref:N-acetylglucosamine kinase n=1 Tax=Microbacterium paludicola TaxID=300019 RepID=UPI0011A06399|nr:BadF/BadG/BcrA/BcrD ATPase family protein [Microbacterium paludicola]